MKGRILDLSGKDYQILRIIWDHYARVRSGRTTSHYVSRGKIVEDMAGSLIKVSAPEDHFRMMESVDTYLMEFSQRGYISIDISPVLFQQGFISVKVPPVTKKYSQDQFRTLDFLSADEKKSILREEDNQISFINLTISGIDICSRLFTSGEAA